MIRHIILILSLILPVLSSCTHNDGDIGDYFGTWKLTSIEIDGQKETSYAGNIFWQFQANIFCMRQINLHNDTDIRWGSWNEISDTSIELNFSHSDNEHEAGSTYYSPIPATGLMASVNILSILSKSKSHITLAYVSDDGKVYRYVLQKW